MNKKKHFSAGAYEGKQALVMGLGLHGGGLEAVKFFLRAGARVTVTDMRTRRELAPSVRAAKRFAKAGGYPPVRFVLGTHRAADFKKADIVLRNAGVRPDSRFLAIARKSGAEVVSDILIFFRACPAPIIGVTGTRGKSTAAYCISEFLKTEFPKRRVWLAGNIRTSVFDILSRVRPNDCVILELSSFQLMDLFELKKSPHIAVVTNILNDHLNWHKSKREYIRAKSFIFRFQKPDDHVFIPAGDSILRRAVRGARSHIHRVSVSTKDRSAISRGIGEHYVSSAGLALAVARHRGVSRRSIKKVLGRFRGLPFRQEEIRVWKGIYFVDDTTATIPDATVAALRRFVPLSRARNGGVILIAGGSDKKLDFREFAAVLARLAKAVIFLPGSATKKMKEECRRYPEIKGIAYDAPSMRRAVGIAAAHARRGDTILLSPGAASFGLFLNEFDRGEQFNREVRRIR